MPSSPLSGKTLVNQYRVEEFIASTPLGELYRATDTRTNNSLGLTALAKIVTDNAEVIKELEFASNNLRGISQPNIIPYLGLFQNPTLAFMLEGWVDGPSLREILLRAPLSVEETLIYIKSLCNSLEALHKQNFIHANLAPELIRINQRGEIFLGGIGAARNMNEKNERKLNKYPRLFYAPEQFNDGPISSATDTYALAVLIYEMITGVWINGKSAPKTNVAIRKAHLELTPPAPISINKEIPDNFSRMILWALRKNPQDRLKTTTELLSSLVLAASAQADKVSLRASPETAPVTAAILDEWHFLPIPKPPLLSQDSIPLQDRLASITTVQPKKRKAQIGFTPILALVMLAGFISLFWLVKPAQIPVAISVKFTPFTVNFTPSPTFTPIPKPTDPHGGRIVFTCTRGDYNQICIVNRDGSNLSQLSDIEASNYYPVFTPDGNSLLFASNRNGPFDLYLLLFGKKELVQITQNIGNVISPDYSPDGRTIVFANRAEGGPTAIWMVNADGLNPRLVYTGADNIVATAWSPDGEKIAYAMSIGIPQEYEIFTMDTNGKNHVRISNRLKGIGGSLDWSPDGKFLLVYAGPYGDKDIFKLEVATGKATQLTNGGNNAGASYSPDGLYIVFNSIRNDEQADLYIMRSNGTNQTQLTNNPEPDWGPQWAR